MKFSTQIMAALSGAFFFFGTLSAADAAGCKIDFTKTINDKDGITGWVYKGKPGTDRAKFSVVTLDGAKVLKAEAVDASGSILFDISRIDCKKYPWLYFSLSRSSPGLIVMACKKNYSNNEVAGCLTLSYREVNRDSL